MHSDAIADCTWAWDACPQAMGRLMHFFQLNFSDLFERVEKLMEKHKLRDVEWVKSMIALEYDGRIRMLVCYHDDFEELIREMNCLTGDFIARVNHECLPPVKK